jgi:CMP-N,N'-diacetyllegionaminic acid synthase
VTTLGLIPARGGSKVVPRKNVRELAGKPVIAWTIEAALACRRLDRVVVSTDSEEIAELARSHGADVPFLRPAEHAQDDTPDDPVYLHALEWLAAHEGFEPDAVAWLRPTAPLRTAEDVEATLRILEQSGADCVRSVCAAEHHPYWMMRLNGDRLRPFVEGTEAYYRRQLLPPVYRLNGAVDAVRCSTVAQVGLFEGDVRAYVMPPERSVDLDGELDFALAEILLLRGSA